MKKKLIAILVVAVLIVSAFMTVGCKKTVEDTSVTYNTTTAVMPSNWNELTYQDNNDTQIMNYLVSAFFEYDFKFDESKGGKYNADGSINEDALVEGGYTVNYSAATKLEDVTKDVDAKWGYSDEEKAEGGYAWRITLRKDLTWDDGTPIKAEDFVYSMKEQLNPEFLNVRANTFYDTLQVKNAGNYFNSKQETVYTTVASQGYATVQEALDAGLTVYADVYNLWGAEGYVDKDGNKVKQWVSITDTTEYDTPESWEAGKAVDRFSAKYLYEEEYADTPYIGVASPYIALNIANPTKDMPFENVGMYQDSEYSFVILFDKSFEFLNDDGSLSYLSAYYMQSLPLVKKSLYESCKQAPKAGSTLWTSNYNSSKETTASWGPYKLAEFQSGKSYKLVKNDKWYGYGIDLYKSQYKIDTVACECVPESNTQWLKFLAGETDDVSIDLEHFDDYKASKYLTYTPDTGTFGMQLFSNLNVLKNSSNNNGILAIDEFRQAFSLSLNRTDIVEKIWPGTAIPCFGVMNSMYFYDVVNGGVYRNTTQAKEGLLRAYGFTQTDGKWSNGAEINNATLDDAYDALTGYNPTKAKELVKEAYKILTENAKEYGYDASKDITFVYGSSSDTAKQRSRAQYLQDVLDNLTKDTELEGKIKVVFDASAGSKWSDAFRSGDTQIGFGYGFSGNPFNPFDIIGSFVDPSESLNYHTYWNTSIEMMTLTLPAGDYAGAGETIEMSILNWFHCLNGRADANDTYKYNWDAGKAPAETRLVILAALEEQVITKSYSVMLIGASTGSLLSPKFTQFTYDYNTFMGFGGLRYMKVNYNNAEWAKYVSSNGNDLTSEYKKSE